MLWFLLPLPLQYSHTVTRKKRTVSSYLLNSDQQSAIYSRLWTMASHLTLQPYTTDTKDTHIQQQYAVADRQIKLSNAQPTSPQPTPVTVNPHPPAYPTSWSHGGACGMPLNPPPVPPRPRLPPLPARAGKRTQRPPTGSSPATAARC
jgi:hypothetical protein